MDGEQEAKLAVIRWEISKQLLGKRDCVWSYHGNRNLFGEERVGGKRGCRTAAKKMQTGFILDHGDKKCSNDFGRKTHCDCVFYVSF